MASDQLKTLTTTSYALLGLLCVQDWSAYELAKQMTRSTSYAWPRAESGVYNEPKNLVAHGYADVRQELTGKRERSVYSVTEQGRKAMATWLKSDTSPPRFESEAMLRIWLLDEGNKETLLDNVGRIRLSATTGMGKVLELTSQYLELGEGPFHQRRHSHLLTAKFLMDYYAMLARWADWAEAEVSDWPELPSEDLTFIEDGLKELKTNHEQMRLEFFEAET